MIEAPKEWKVLAVATIQAIEKIDKECKRKQPLSKSVLEFGQFLGLLAIAGGKDLDGGDDHEHDDRRDQNKQ